MAKKTDNSKEIKDLEEAINSPATPEPQKAKMREILQRLKNEKPVSDPQDKFAKQIKGAIEKGLAKHKAKTEKAKMPVVTLTAGGESIKVQPSGSATNFDIRISKSEAERLVKSKKVNDDKFGTIMCKEYGEDEDWVGMTDEDLDEETGKFDSDYKTFEIELSNDVHISEPRTSGKSAIKDWNKKETTTEKGKAPYDCDDLIAKERVKAEKRKANKEKHKNDPKKTEATKNVEKIEKVETALDKRIAKNEVTKSELQKLITETEALLNKLKNALKTAK